MNKVAVLFLLALGASSSLYAGVPERVQGSLQARTPVKNYRVRFTRGHSSAIVSGVAGFENWQSLHNYKVHANAGQTLNVRLLSGQGRVQFDVYNTKRRDIFVSSGGEDTTQFQAKLPYSGDYVISVYGIKRNAKYRIQIEVK